ncbi:MAG: LPS export ABC transporter periplasmic protein LptC [Candidatus Binatia bacterium]
MSRQQIRFIIAIIVLSLLTFVGYHLTIARPVGEELSLGEDLPTTAQQRMQDFRRSKTRADGKKAWEIVAHQARYLEETQTVIVDGPEFSVYLENGDIISLRSREARVQLDDKRHVVQVKLKGDLKIQLGDFSLSTQEALFEDEQNTITSTSPVQIDGPGLTVVGQGYTVDVTNKLFTLNADVQTTISKREG